MSDPLIIKCPCGQKNRIARTAASRGRFRCGACKHEFTQEELMKASIARTFEGMGVSGVRFEGGSGFDFNDV